MSGAARLPVWLYWEGPCPEWIAACRRTILRHAPDAFVLDAAAFDELWDRDRDIDLARWHVAHRSDFIRAFLLARHGGLWIDCDCLVMRSLADLRRLAAEVDFVAHRERSGMVSNAFIAARPGSRTAAELYRRVCEALRTRQSLEWTDLGGTPLSRTLADPPGPWLELPCRSVQPLCWSDTGELFRAGTPAQHAARFDREALCYMLSNQQVGYHREREPGADLLAEGTFFRYLLARASGEPEEAAGDPRGPAAMVTAPCARVAFHETMGYSVARLWPGASSHNNEARPFRDIPAALAGKAFTQVVAGRVSPVEIEFRTPGKLFVLAGTDWAGGAQMARLLDGAGRREGLPPLATESGAAFEVFSVTGRAGERLSLPTQVMLVADELMFLGQGEEPLAVAAAGAPGAAPRAPARRQPRALVIAAGATGGPLATFFRVLPRLRWADANGFVPVVAGVAGAWERFFEPVSSLRVDQLLPQLQLLPQVAGLDAAALAEALAGRAVVWDASGGDEDAAGVGVAAGAAQLDDGERALAAAAVARYVRVRAETVAAADEIFGRDLAGRPVVGVELDDPPAAVSARCLSELDRRVAAEPEARILAVTGGGFGAALASRYGERVVAAGASGAGGGGGAAGEAAALVGALLLARSGHLVHGGSNVAAAALLFNRALPHTAVGAVGGGSAS